MIASRRLSYLGALFIAALVAFLATAVRAETLVDEGKTRSVPTTWKTAPEVTIGQSAMRMAQGLAACLALLAFGVVGYRRFHSGKGPIAQRRMRVAERLPISGKTALYIVEVDGFEYLTSVGSEQVHLQPIAQHPDLKREEWDEVCGSVSVQPS